MLKVQYSLDIEKKYYNIIANRKMQKFQNRTFEDYDLATLIHT